MKKAPSGKQRGFVLVVVMAAAIVVTAVVASQYVTSQQSQAVGVRASEEAQARSIAESCLSMVSAAIDQVNPAPTVGDDYDAILAGPNATSGDADDFVPFGTRVITIPTGGGSTLNQWELIAVGNGVCAVRFDDNGDDGRLALPGNTFDDVDEGTANDNPFKDRDRSIFVTAIGLFPAAAADADVYDRAHARVTLRRAIQRVNVFQPLAPAIWANTVDAASNVDICGLGGVNAAGGLTAASNTCFCGQMNGTLAGADPPASGDMCAGCPSTASLPAPPPPACIATTISPAAAQAPATWVHWSNMNANGQNDREGWSSPPEVALAAQSLSGTPTGYGVDADPGNDGSIVGGVAAGTPAPFCAFYADHSQQALFVWDSADEHTRTTLQTDIPALQALGVTPLGPGGADIPQHDCSGGGPLHNADPIPEPCTWNFFGLPPNIDCAANQTPCWKLQTFLMGLPDAEVGIGPLTFSETTADFGDEEWHPHVGVDLPHVTPGRHFGPGANRLCGDAANNCASCRDASDLLTDDNAEYAVRKNWLSHFHLEDGMNNEYMPSPSVWIFNTTDKVHFNSGFGSGSGPWRATIITNSYFDIDGSGDLCCATCDCATAAGINRADCGMNDLFGKLDADVASLTADPGADQVFDGAGRIALKARGDIDIDSSTTIVGDVRAGSVDINGSVCIVGNVIGYATPTANPCNTGGTCNNAYVCSDSDVAINGDVHSMGDIESSSNTDYYGNLVSKGSICLASNSQVNGALMATNTVEMASNTTVVSSSTTTTGLPQNANPPITTYMEASW